MIAYKKNLNVCVADVGIWTRAKGGLHLIVSAYVCALPRSCTLAYPLGAHSKWVACLAVLLPHPQGCVCGSARMCVTRLQCMPVNRGSANPLYMMQTVHQWGRHQPSVGRLSVAASMACIRQRGGGVYSQIRVVGASWPSITGTRLISAVVLCAGEVSLPCTCTCPCLGRLAAFIVMYYAELG